MFLKINSFNEKVKNKMRISYDLVSNIKSSSTIFPKL